MSGNFLARLGEKRRERLAKLAAERGVSVNQLLCEAADLLLEGGGMPSSEARKAVLDELAGVLPRLRQGYVLMPSAEVPDAAGPGSWSRLMNGDEP